MKRNKMQTITLKNILQTHCLLTILLFSTSILAQKAEPETELKYLKHADQTRTLKYWVKYIKDSSDNASEAVGIPVTFYVGSAKEKLATVKTNGYGVAEYVVPANTKLPANKGVYTFYASVDANEIVEIKSDSVSLVDFEIEMRLELVDSVKTVLFKTFEIDAKGVRVPVEADLVFYVPRTFSNYKFAEGSSNESGDGEVEFPEGLPGDSLGNLTVIAMLEDNEKYANVENSQTIAWGTPTNYHIEKFHRALWTTIAPTWMIVTLTILLLGVWGHYIYVIFKVFKIRKEGKNND